MLDPSQIALRCYAQQASECGLSKPNLQLEHAFKQLVMDADGSLMLDLHQCFFARSALDLFLDVLLNFFAVLHDELSKAEASGVLAYRLPVRVKLDVSNANFDNGMILTLSNTIDRLHQYSRVCVVEELNISNNVGASNVAGKRLLRLQSDYPFLRHVIADGCAMNSALLRRFQPPHTIAAVAEDQPAEQQAPLLEDDFSLGTHTTTTEVEQPACAVLALPDDDANKMVCGSPVSVVAKCSTADDDAAADVALDAADTPATTARKGSVPSSPCNPLSEHSPQKPLFSSPVRRPSCHSYSRTLGPDDNRSISTSSLNDFGDHLLRLATAESESGVLHFVVVPHGDDVSCYSLLPHSLTLPPELPAAVSREKSYLQRLCEHAMEANGAAVVPHLSRLAAANRQHASRWVPAGY